MKKFILSAIICIYFSNTFSQNVGIGTNAPAFKLDVQGRMRVKTGVLGNTSTTSGIWMEDYRDGTNQIFFGMQDSIRVGFYGSGTGGVGWDFNFNAKTGTVGMGRIATTYRLELDNTNGNNLGLYKNGVFGGGFIVTDSTMEIQPKAGSTVCFPNPCPASDLILIPPALNFSTSGNVGIGTNLPLAKLTVVDNAEIVSEFANSHSLSNGTDTKILFKTGNYYTGAIGTYGTGTNTSRLGLSTYASSSSSALTERISILDDGKTGIGTTTPKATLDINGGIALPIKMVTGNYSFQDGDYTVVVDMQQSLNYNINIYLPSTVNATGRIVKIIAINLPNIGYGPHTPGSPNGKVRVYNSDGTAFVSSLYATITEDSYTNGLGNLVRDYNYYAIRGMTLQCLGTSWITTDFASDRDSFYDSYRTD